MRLRLTVLATPPCDVHERAGPCMHELEVDAPAGSTCAHLVRALADQFGGRGPMLTADGSTVAGDLRVGSPPVIDGSVVRWGRPNPAADSPGPAAGATIPSNPVQLWVRHGPDAGRMIDLSAESLTVGRSALATVVLHDASLSRVHLEVRRDAMGVTVRDLTSTNGSRLDDAPLTTARVRLEVGAVLRVGDSELMLGIAAGPPPAVTAACGDGTFVVNRRPRTIPQREPPLVAFPDPPPAAEPRRPIAWTHLAAPVVAASVMAAFFGPSMLVFALVGPLVAVMSAWTDRRRGRRNHAELLAQGTHRRAEALATLDQELAVERTRRRDASPDPAILLAIALGPGARLWERRRDAPDWLHVAIGTCICDSTIRVSGMLPDELGTRPPQVVGSPCVLPLAEIGVLGIAGPRDRVAGVVRALLGQLVTLHSPTDLNVVVLGADRRADDWSWLGRVPHCRSVCGEDEQTAAGILDRDSGSTAALVDGLARLMRRRRPHQSATGQPWSGLSTVALLDGAAALRPLPGLTELLAGGADVGLTFIALETEASALPAEAAAVLDVTGRPTLHYPGHRHEDLLVDQVGSWWTERLSRALAPLRDAAPSNTGSPSLPGTVGLLEILPGSDAGEGVEDRWRRSAPTAIVPIGASARGPWMLDLVGDGPHVLVAGTTGSGKSELLRTLVGSLAAHNSPEDVAFVLVDYKGGAAFRRCTALPHVLATITDLDDELARRALIWLRAEVRRREVELRRFMADDFEGFQDSPETARTMPRLFVIVDEFRALAHELPAFVDGVVDLAARGRSLGIHVVLATQRPAGVVTADVKANLSLRIALRVRDSVDSLDVVDAPDAAAIDPATPGRALVRTAAADLVAVQSAHSRARSEPRTLRVRELTWGSMPTEWPRAGAVDGASDVATDLDRIVAAILDASARRPAVPGMPRWLSPLSTRVTHSELPEPTSPDRCVLGVLDRPRHQDQVPLELELDVPGHWTLVGAARSGRTTGLFAFADAATSRFPPGRVHLYAISNGSLDRLATLPHCGAHVHADDVARLERLVSILSEEVRRRRRRGVKRISPHLVLLVDDWDYLAAPQRPSEHAAVVHRLLGLLRDGESHGLTAVIAGGRSLLVGAGLASRRRLLLRLADPGDAVLAGAPSAVTLDQWPPGRAWLADDTVAQLATGDPPVPAASAGDPDAVPRRVDPLPWPVMARAMPRDHPQYVGSAGRIVLGLGGDELGPLALDETADGRRWLVAGSPRSGVSTALLLVARHLVGSGRRVTLVSARPGPLDALRSDRRVAWHAPHDAVDSSGLALAADSTALVVDRVDELARTPAEAVLRDAAYRLVAAGGLVIVGGHAAALATQHSGLGADVARTRTGGLLGPGAATDGHVFGIRVRADQDAPPGRGHLVRQGRAVPIQLALPDDLQAEVT